MPHIICCIHLSDESQTESHTRITDVYHDPMDLVGIEDLVLGILKTGKLSIHGEPGGEQVVLSHRYNMLSRA